MEIREGVRKGWGEKKQGKLDLLGPGKFSSLGHWNYFPVQSCSSQTPLPVFCNPGCSVISSFDVPLISLLTKV